jgi:hypothetical protein
MSLISLYSNELINQNKSRDLIDFLIKKFKYIDPTSEILSGGGMNTSFYTSEKISILNKKNQNILRHIKDYLSMNEKRGYDLYGGNLTITQDNKNKILNSEEIFGGFNNDGELIDNLGGKISDLIGGKAEKLLVKKYKYKFIFNFGEKKDEDLLDEFIEKYQEEREKVNKHQEAIQVEFQILNTVYKEKEIKMEELFKLKQQLVLLEVIKENATKRDEVNEMIKKDFYSKLQLKQNANNVKYLTKIVLALENEIDSLNAAIEEKGKEQVYGFFRSLFINLGFKSLKKPDNVYILYKKIVQDDTEKIQMILDTWIKFFDEERGKIRMLKKEVDLLRGKKNLAYRQQELIKKFDKKKEYYKKLLKYKSNIADKLNKDRQKQDKLLAAIEVLEDDFKNLRSGEKENLLKIYTHNVKNIFVQLFGIIETYANYIELIKDIKKESQKEYDRYMNLISNRYKIKALEKLFTDYYETAKKTYSLVHYTYATIVYIRNEFIDKRQTTNLHTQVKILIPAIDQTLIMFQKLFDIMDKLTNNKKVNIIANAIMGKSGGVLFDTYDIKNNYDKHKHKFLFNNQNPNEFRITDKTKTLTNFINDFSIKVNNLKDDFIASSQSSLNIKDDIKNHHYPYINDIYNRSLLRNIINLDNKLYEDNVFITNYLPTEKYLNMYYLHNKDNFLENKANLPDIVNIPNNNIIPGKIQNNDIAIVYNNDGNTFIPPNNTVYNITEVQPAKIGTITYTAKEVNLMKAFNKDKDDGNKYHFLLYIRSNENFNLYIIDESGNINSSETIKNLNQSSLGTESNNLLENNNVLKLSKILSSMEHLGIDKINLRKRYIYLFSFKINNKEYQFYTLKINDKGEDGGIYLENAFAPLFIKINKKNEDYKYYKYDKLVPIIGNKLCPMKYKKDANAFNINNNENLLELNLVSNDADIKENTLYYNFNSIDTKILTFNREDKTDCNIIYNNNQNIKNNVKYSYQKKSGNIEPALAYSVNEIDLNSLHNYDYQKLVNYYNMFPNTEDLHQTQILNENGKNYLILNNNLYNQINYLTYYLQFYVFYNIFILKNYITHDVLEYNKSEYINHTFKLNKIYEYINKLLNNDKISKNKYDMIDLKDDFDFSGGAFKNHFILNLSLNNVIDNSLIKHKESYLYYFNKFSHNSTLVPNTITNKFTEKILNEENGEVPILLKLDQPIFKINNKSILQKRVKFQGLSAEKQRQVDKINEIFTKNDLIDKEYINLKKDSIRPLSNDKEDVFKSLEEGVDSLNSYVIKNEKIELELSSFVTSRHSVMLPELVTEGSRISYDSKDKPLSEDAAKLEVLVEGIARENKTGEYGYARSDLIEEFYNELKTNLFKNITTFKDKPTTDKDYNYFISYKKNNINTINYIQSNNGFLNFVLFVAKKIQQIQDLSQPPDIINMKTYNIDRNIMKYIFKMFNTFDLINLDTLVENIENAKLQNELRTIKGEVKQEMATTGKGGDGGKAGKKTVNCNGKKEAECKKESSCTWDGKNCKNKAGGKGNAGGKKKGNAGGKK